jgi:hypothetical protein
VGVTAEEKSGQAGSSGFASCFAPDHSRAIDAVRKTTTSREIFRVDFFISTLLN